MAGDARLQFIAYSDYLCPWCANGSLRLHRLEDEYEGEISIEWRSYLLRPYPRKPAADALAAAEQLEKFRHYTTSWERPAADEDAAEFHLWCDDNLEGPPSHSVPAHVVAKAAQRSSAADFRRLHERLMRAYFSENRDISARDTLFELWREVGLGDSLFPEIDDPELTRVVVDEHNDAIARGVTGVPAVRLVGNDSIIVGAQPMQNYRRWAERALSRLDSTESENAS